MATEEIDVNSLKTIEEVDAHLVSRKDNLHKRMKIKSSLEEDKRANAAAYRDQIKVVKEELNYEMGIIDELANRKLVLAGGKLLGDAPTNE